MTSSKQSQRAEKRAVKALLKASIKVDEALTAGIDFGALIVIGATPLKRRQRVDKFIRAIGVMSQAAEQVEYELIIADETT